MKNSSRKRRKRRSLICRQCMSVKDAVPDKSMLKLSAPVPPELQGLLEPEYQYPSEITQQQIDFLRNGGPTLSYHENLLKRVSGAYKFSASIESSIQKKDLWRLGPNPSERLKHEQERLELLIDAL